MVNLSILFYFSVS